MTMRMPNIEGNYTLTEVATQLEVSLTWINKVQIKTGVAKRPFEQGMKASFIEEEVKMLYNVKLLRTLDYTLDDIQKIYNKEVEMLKLSNTHITAIASDLPGDYKYIINPCYIDRSIQDKKYSELLSAYLKLSSEVVRRADKLGEDMATYTKYRNERTN